MRFVEFVGFIVALIALSAWLLGRPHTLDSVRASADARRAAAAPGQGDADDAPDAGRHD